MLHLTRTCVTFRVEDDVVKALLESRALFHLKSFTVNTKDLNSIVNKVIKTLFL